MKIGTEPQRSGMMETQYQILVIKCKRLVFTYKANQVRGGSRLQIRLRQSSVIKAPINFLNIHKLLWKSKILVHGHVRLFLNVVTFPLIVLIKIVQVIKNIFLGTGFIINNKPPLNKRTVKHDQIMLSLRFLQEYIWVMEEYIQITFRASVSQQSVV